MREMLLSFVVVVLLIVCLFFFFFFNDTATTEIYTLSLHDALPISPGQVGAGWRRRRARQGRDQAPGARRSRWAGPRRDRRPSVLGPRRRCVAPPGARRQGQATRSSRR